MLNVLDEIIYFLTVILWPVILQLYTHINSSSLYFRWKVSNYNFNLNSGIRVSPSGPQQKVPDAFIYETNLISIHVIDPLLLYRIKSVVKVKSGHPEKIYF